MPYGKIMILNGASSAGKTSLLMALQACLEEPYLNAGIDKFIWMLPERFLERPLWDDVLGRATEAGKTGQRLFSGMHHTIAALSRGGNNVLADHVLVEPGWVVECARLFEGLPAYLIGVRCPLDVLERREIDRRDRTLGQARAQFERVHAHGFYDLEIDTSLESVAESAARIQAYLASGAAPSAFQRVRALSQP